MSLKQYLLSILPFTGLRRKTRRFFYMELGQMLDAGIPTLRSLKTLSEKHYSKRLSRALADCTQHIQDGGTLASGLKQHPLLFPSLEVRLIEVAEYAGSLPAALTRIAEFLERVMAFWRQLFNGLIYPAFLLIVAFIVIPLFQAFFLGRFDEVLWITLWRLARFAGWVLILVIGWKALKHLDGMRYIIHSLVLQIPIFGRLARRVAHARFANIFECLYSIGVPVPEALTRAALACGNERVAQRILKAIPIVKDGGSIREGLFASMEFNPIALSIVEVGEMSGKLDASLRKYAEHENQEAAYTLDSMAKIVPTMIYLMVMLYLAIMILQGFSAYFSMIDTIGQ